MAELIVLDEKIAKSQQLQADMTNFEKIVMDIEEAMSSDDLVNLAN